MKSLTGRKDAASTEETSDLDYKGRLLQRAVKSTFSLAREGLIFFGLLCAVFEIAENYSRVGGLSQAYQRNGAVNPTMAISDQSHSRSTQRKTNRYKIGSWIGDIWLPPEGWHIYSHQEIQKVLGDKSIMFVGDSTARRGAGTLYSLLAHNPSPVQANDDEEKLAAKVVGNGEIDKIINLNKEGRETQMPCALHGWNKTTTVNYPQTCLPMPNTTNSHPTEPKDFVIMRTVCFKDIEHFFLSELEGRSTILETAQTELLVIAAGVWESARPWDCREKSRTREQIWEDTLAAVQRIQTQRPDMMIIWRTSGFHAAMNLDHKVIHDLNNYFMDRLDAIANPKIAYVNFGGAIEPKSFGRDRLEGDLPAHYGPIPRIVFCQMIVNAYVDISSWGKAKNNFYWFHSRNS